MLHVLPSGLYFPEDKSREQTSQYFLRFSTMSQITVTEWKGRKNAKYLHEHRFQLFLFSPQRFHSASVHVKTLETADFHWKKNATVLPVDVFVPTPSVQLSGYQKFS